MFKKAILFGGMIFIINLNATEPHLQTVTKEVDREGQKYIQTERNIRFDNGNLRFLTLNEEGKKEIVKKKWGDYFLGLDFGRAKNTNGSWSIWDFFECHVRINGKYLIVPQMFLPENVYVTKLNDVTMAEIISPLSADGKSGKMSMRFMQFPSHKDWLFIRVKFIDTTIAPWRITFQAFPGNSNNPQERERWIATPDSQYCVSKEKYSFAPKSNALVMYSKFVHENFGNFLVFESEKFREITLYKSSTVMPVWFFPKKGEKELKFALGYFMDKPTADELPRFLGETQDVIYKFMNGIDWDPKINSAEFDRLAVETEKILKDLGDDGKKIKLNC